MVKETHAKVQPNSARAWIQVFRPFTYTASLIPVLLGAALVLYQKHDARWYLVPLIVIASLLIQAATNLVSEYYDYKKGVDRPETYGSSRAIVDGLVNPTHVFYVGLLCFALTGAIGLIFVALCGWPILVIGSVGMLGGFLYTATPAGYKYFGLGDLFVFCLMGPLMVIGSFFVLCGAYNHTVLWASLPVGFLVAAILSGNNLRDITHDQKADINTPATLLGHRWARWEYTSLIAGAYIATVVMVAMKVLPLWSLITLLTIPPAIKNIKTVMNNKPDNPEEIITLDVQTAQLHMPFGLLLIISLILGAFL